MNCLIVVPSLLRAGAETQAVDLANGLAARGNTVHLCCFERFHDQRGRLSPSVKFHYLARGTYLGPSFLAAMARLIDREDIDVVQGVLQISVLAARFASNMSRRRPPVVAAVHTTVNRGLKQELFDKVLYRRILRRTAAVIFVCKHQRDYWVGRYPELGPLSRVVYNGVAPERFRRVEHLEAGRQLRDELGIPEGAAVFACVAAFRPEKGHDLLIEAFSRLPGQSFLILAGDGDRRRSIEKKVAEEGLQERVRFLGVVGDSRPIITASTATVLASTAVETFSMAMLESMALGVPMIAPKIGGLPEAIKHEASGLLFPVGDTLELARWMTLLSEYPSKALELGRTAEEVVVRQFTCERMVSETEGILFQASSSAG